MPHWDGSRGSPAGLRPVKPVPRDGIDRARREVPFGLVWKRQRRVAEPAETTRLMGNTGSDALTGGTGADKLSGRSEADTFDFTSIKHIAVDVSVRDFSRNEATSSTCRRSTPTPFKRANRISRCWRIGVQREGRGQETVCGRTHVHGNVSSDSVSEASTELNGRQQSRQPASSS